MNIDKQYIFVDESGNTHLPETPDNGHDYYVIAGLLVPSIGLSTSLTAAQEIVVRHAGNGELKSSNIGNNSDRRRRILREIGAANFRYYCLVVDKNRIWRDSGLRWKPSFYKFLHRMFYGRIKGAFLEMQIIADQYGRTEFMDSFKTYIGQMGSLFETFTFESSETNPFLQLADVVAGSVRRVYSGEDQADIFATVGNTRIPIEEWPPKDAWGEQPPEQSQYDEAIRGISLRAVRDYIERNLGSDDEDALLRAHTFRYLLFRFEEDPQQYVYRSEIISYLRAVTRTEMSEQSLTTKIIADARDSDVIIASTDAGIKIPYDAQDLSNWMSRVESQVAPYLRRVEKARQLIWLASNQQHDIATANRFPALSKYLGIQ